MSGQNFYFQNSNNEFTKNSKLIDNKDAQIENQNIIFKNSNEFIITFEYDLNGELINKEELFINLLSINIFNLSNLRFKIIHSDGYCDSDCRGYEKEDYRKIFISLKKQIGINVKLNTWNIENINKLIFNLNEEIDLMYKDYDFEEDEAKENLDIKLKDLNIESFFSELFFKIYEENDFSLEKRNNLIILLRNLKLLKDNNSLDSEILNDIVTKMKKIIIFSV